jgi:hypothetical protein
MACIPARLALATRGFENRSSPRWREDPDRATMRVTVGRTAP